MLSNFVSSHFTLMFETFSGTNPEGTATWMTATCAVLFPCRCGRRLTPGCTLRWVIKSSRSVPCALSKTRQQASKTRLARPRGREADRLRPPRVSAASKLRSEGQQGPWLTPLRRTGTRQHLCPTGQNSVRGYPSASLSRHPNIPEEQMLRS